MDNKFSKRRKSWPILLYGWLTSVVGPSILVLLGRLGDVDTVCAVFGKTSPCSNKIIAFLLDPEPWMLILYVAISMSLAFFAAKGWFAEKQESLSNRLVQLEIQAKQNDFYWSDLKEVDQQFSDQFLKVNKKLDGVTAVTDKMERIWRNQQAKDLEDVVRKALPLRPVAKGNMPVWYHLMARQTFKSVDHAFPEARKDPNIMSVEEQTKANALYSTINPDEVGI
jgi:hypothetical protein